MILQLNMDSCAVVKLMRTSETLGSIDLSILKYSIPFYLVSGQAGAPYICGSGNTTGEKRV